MPKILLATILVVSGCWTATPRTRDGADAAMRQPRLPSNEDGICHETGERLLLLVCRRGHDLEWKVSNLTDRTLWVFVAPPAINTGPRRANAFMYATGGSVLLRKVQLFANIPEPLWSGAIALEAGASDAGVVVLGTRLDRRAQNFYGEPRGQRITSVTLEVGFAEQRSTDRTHPLQEFMLVMNLDRARQEIVRSQALSWL